MDSPFGTAQLLLMVIYLCWIFVDILVAVFAFYRFRSTASGLFMGFGYIVLVFRSLMFSLLAPMFLALAKAGPDAFAMSSLMSTVVRSCAYLAIFAGVIMIPRSLRKLSEKT